MEYFLKAMLLSSCLQQVSKKIKLSARFCLATRRIKITQQHLYTANSDQTKSLPKFTGIQLKFTIYLIRSVTDEPDNNKINSFHNVLQIITYCLAKLETSENLYLKEKCRSNQKNTKLFRVQTINCRKLFPCYKISFERSELGDQRKPVSKGNGSGTVTVLIKSAIMKVLEVYFDISLTRLWDVTHKRHKRF